MLFSPTFLLFSSIFLSPFLRLSLSDAEVAEDVIESFLAWYGATCDVAKLNKNELEVFGNKVATKSEIEGFTNTR